MNRRNFLTALSCGSRTLLSLPAATKTAQSDGKVWQPDGFLQRAVVVALIKPRAHIVPLEIGEDVSHKELVSLRLLQRRIAAAVVEAVDQRGRTRKQIVEVPSRWIEHSLYISHAAIVIDHQVRDVAGIVANAIEHQPSHPVCPAQV